VPFLKFSNKDIVNLKKKHFISSTKSQSHRAFVKPNVILKIQKKLLHFATREGHTNKRKTL